MGERSVLCMSRAEQQKLSVANRFYKIEFASKLLEVNIGPDTIFYDNVNAEIVVPPYEPRDGAKSFFVMFSCETTQAITHREDVLRCFVHTVAGRKYHPPEEPPTPWNAQGVTYGGPFFYGVEGPPPNPPNLDKKGLRPQIRLNVSTILSVPPSGDSIVAECQGQQHKAETKGFLGRYIVNSKIFIYQLENIPYPYEVSNGK